VRRQGFARDTSLPLPTKSKTAKPQQAACANDSGGNKERAICA